jgi:methionyl aminopeptidase
MRSAHATLHVATRIEGRCFFAQSASLAFFGLPPASLEIPFHFHRQKFHVAIEIKSPQEIERMRTSCRLAAEVLDFIAPYVQEGITTGELDRLCHDYIIQHGAIPAPLNYRGFPKSICTSINEVICHGIPDQTKLRNGDIINLDITTIVDGWYGDTSEMYLVGEVSDEARTLVEHVRESMWVGILQVHPSRRLGDIGAAIFDFSHRKHGYGVVEAFCGHGIGREFHMEPRVKHVAAHGSGPRLHPGMTFTIEPMINLGTPHHEMLDDGWTAITADRRLSAQTEHTILVTPTGYEVLTARESAYLPPGTSWST